MATITYSCINPKTNDVEVEKTEIEKLVEPYGAEAVVEFEYCWDWRGNRWDWRGRDVICITNISNIYANYAEEEIINNMNCWGSYYENALEVHYKKITKNSTKSEERTTREEINRLKKDQMAEITLGRKQLYNDTTFIDIIRNDSLYKALLAERKEISKSLSIYKDKVPFFEKFIDKINNDIIEYNAYSHSYWNVKKPQNISPNDGKYYLSAKDDYGGCYAYSKSGLGIFEGKHYKNYSDLLKEEYEKGYDNLNIKDEDIKKLNSILKSLEKLDRALWAVKYYKISQKEREKKKEELNKMIQKREHIEKLFE